MASIIYSVSGKKDPSSIYIRFIEGKAIDLKLTTGLKINPKYWNKKKQEIRDVIDVPNRQEINTKLTELQLYIFTQYNSSYMIGEIIDSAWLKNAIATFFKRPAQNKDRTLQTEKIYLVDFARWWMKEKQPAYKVAADKLMDARTKTQYESVIESLVAIEKEKKVRIRLKELPEDIFYSIANHFRVTEGYSEETTKRKIARVKFFFGRAESENIIVDKAYEDNVYIKKEEENYKHPYLSPEEIDTIFKLDLSHHETLSIVRDNFIIGLWTGLRISDFLVQLRIGNIDGEFIEIKTTKTGHYVSIPLHGQVKAVLRKYHWNLPPKISEQKFNDHVKTICQIAEIDYEMMGGIMQVDPVSGKKRKVVGIYKKYLLVSSHICRRSMATNLFGQVDNKVIMDVCGWATEQQMRKYNKETNKESAIKLQKHWEKTQR